MAANKGRIFLGIVFVLGGSMFGWGSCWVSGATVWVYRVLSCALVLLGIVHLLMSRKGT